MKQKVVKLGGLFLMMSLFPLDSYSQSAPSLHEILDSAVVNDYHLENKQLGIESSRLDQEKIKDAYMPKVSVDGMGGYLYSGFDVTSPAFALPNLGTIIPENTNHYTLSSYMVTANAKASFLLYGGGKVGALKKANAAKINAETTMLEKDKQEIIGNALTAYDQLLMLKEVKKVLDESSKRLDENKKTADKAFSYGIITSYEQQKIELAQAQLQAKYREYEGKRQLILMHLHMLTNIEIERLEKIDSELEVAVVTKATSFENRPEVNALNYAVTANEYKVRAAKTWWVPKVGASASLGYLGLLDGNLRSKDPMLLSGQKLNHDFNNFNVFPLFNAGIGLKWDIFDGREGIVDVKKAKLDLLIAENNRKDATEKLGLNLKKTEIELNVANEQLNVKDKAREIARNAFYQASEEFKVGLIKSTQLIEAENDVQTAELEYAQAIFAQRRAVAEYLKAAGNLTESSFK